METFFTGEENFLKAGGHFSKALINTVACIQPMTPEYPAGVLWRCSERMHFSRSSLGCGLAITTMLLKSTLNLPLDFCIWPSGARIIRGNKVTIKGVDIVACM